MGKKSWVCILEGVNLENRKNVVVFVKIRKKLVVNELVFLKIKIKVFLDSFMVFGNVEFI